MVGSFSLLNRTARGIHHGMAVELLRDAGIPVQQRAISASGLEVSRAELPAHGFETIRELYVPEELRAEALQVLSVLPFEISATADVGENANVNLRQFPRWIYALMIAIALVSLVVGAIRTLF